MDMTAYVYIPASFLAAGVVVGFLTGVIGIILGP